MENKTYKLGAVEWRFKFTNVKDGREVEAISTPASFAIADIWTDRINATGEQTPEFALIMQSHILAALTLRHEGLVAFALPKNVDTLVETVYTALNEWDYDMIEAPAVDETDGEDDPLATAPGADLATVEAR